MYYYYHYQSSLGKLTIASDEEYIIGLWIEDQKYCMDILKDRDCQEKETDVIKLAEEWLERYFKKENPPITDLPIKFIGSDFRKIVWEILTEIPYGTIITYKGIAQMVEYRNGINKMSAQAIGGAVSHNPISIIVPCHRVIGSNNNLLGYSGGLDNKMKLLELEGINIHANFKGLSMMSYDIMNIYNLKEEKEKW